VPRHGSARPERRADSRRFAFEELDLAADLETETPACASFALEAGMLA
jgi:hypothetical protein